LTYHNGTTFGGEVSSVGMDIAMSFANIAEKNFSYHTRLNIVTTPNTDDPAASADFVSFTAGGFPYTLNVFEGNNPSVDVMAKLTSNLALTPAQASDKDPNGTPLTDVYGFGLTLVSLANPSDGGFISSIPEPASLAQFGCGLLLMLGLVWRGST